MSNYATVTWTSGDTITEAKMDNMVSNDRAEDAHETGLYMLNSTGIIKFRNASSTLDGQIYEDSNNILQFVRGSGGFAGLDVALATQIRGNISAGANKAQFPPAIRAMTIQEVIVQVAGDGTQAAGDMTFDINKNGSTIWSTQANRVKLVASQPRGTQTTFDTVSVAKYDNFSLDVDITDTTAKNLLFIILGR
jgi:hypothetical protein